jgi:hypothetical protein
VRAGGPHRSLLLLTFVLLLPASHAWGYRPFVSTDAAVADPQEMEIELGYFNLKRAAQENTFIVPQLRLNYGFTRNWEVVGEFEIEQSHDEEVQIVDAGLSLKAILQEGILQNKDSIGFAVEVGPLLPSTALGERRFGFEGIGIVSGRLSPFTYHVNFGGGVDRAKTNPFAIWGMIVELPIFPHFRLVGEVNGESIEGERADHSGLLGFIWQPPSSAVFIDAGVRRGISRAASDWLFTTGLTWSFSLPAISGAATVGGIP